MSKSLCIMDENPAPLSPSPPLCWTSLAFLPSSKIYMFFCPIYRKKLHIWRLLACIRALSLKVRFHWHNVNSTPCLNWLEQRPERTTCKKRHATPAVSTAPRVTSCRGDTRWYSTSWVQRSSKETKRVKLEKDGVAVLSCRAILKHSAHV